MHSSYFWGFDEPMQKYNRMKIPSIEGLKGTFIILIDFFFKKKFRIFFNKTFEAFITGIWLMLSFVYCD